MSIIRGIYRPNDVNSVIQFYNKARVATISFNYNNLPIKENTISCNTLLSIRNQKGVIIWVSPKGNICYKFAMDGKVYMSAPQQASNAISSFCSMNIQINKEFKPLPNNILPNNSLPKKLQILIPELMLVEDGVFNPKLRAEFYINVSNGDTIIPNNNIIFDYANSICKNKYLPKSYNQIEANTQKSIILQYIFYLSNYEKDRFLYLMTWISYYLDSEQNNIFPNILVLVGDETILFEHIITPLFEEKYCMKLDESIFKNNNISKIPTDILFYHISNINKDFDIKILKKLKRQILINTDDKNLSFSNNDDITIFKIKDKLENIHIPESLIDPNYKINRRTLLYEIKNDLDNFIAILSYFQFDSFTITDDSNLISKTLNQKLDEFYSAIKNKDTTFFMQIENEDPLLYEELIADFNKSKIKQPNIFKCFTIIYSEENISSPKTLMTQLRKINNDFFELTNIKSGSGGLKYFDIN